MALKAGYKGIKKKYADAINSGQGGGGGGVVSGVKSKVYTGKGGTETVINLDSAPSKIIGIMELGTHGNGYWGFLVAFNSGACKGLWVTPNNNAISGVNLSYSVEGSVLTITGGQEGTQRGDATGVDYVVLYL